MSAQPYSRADRNRIARGVVPRRVVGRSPAWWVARQPISARGVAATGGILSLPGTTATGRQRIVVLDYGTPDQVAGLLFGRPGSG